MLPINIHGFTIYIYTACWSDFSIIIPATQITIQIYIRARNSYATLYRSKTGLYVVANDDNNSHPFRTHHKK